MMNPFSWLQMTNMISYQGLVRTFPRVTAPMTSCRLKWGLGAMLKQRNHKEQQWSKSITALNCEFVM
ncbi:hypothetical protein ACK334_00005, partial [Aeromonas veronii]